MNRFKTVAAMTALTAIASAAQAEISANIGATSDYIWRGVSQSNESASVSGGVDYADESGLYAGTWVGSLGDGNGSEVDLYLGYAGETDVVSYDVGYIYYNYPTIEGDFGEVYGSVGFGAFTVGAAYTTNNDSANDGGPFVSGDLYYYGSVGGDLTEDWTVGFTLGNYTFDEVSGADYVHYQVDFGTSTDAGDFTFTISDTDNDGDDLRAVVSWGIGF